MGVPVGEFVAGFIVVNVVVDVFALLFAEIVVVVDVSVVFGAGEVVVEVVAVGEVVVDVVETISTKLVGLCVGDFEVGDCDGVPVG